MNKNPGEERIRKELQRGADFLEPVNDQFYQTVWTRIATHPESVSKSAWSAALQDLGVVCWRAAPACFLWLLLVGGFMFFYPPRALPEVMLSAESFILDLAEAPADEVMLLEIMNAMPDSAHEVRP